MRQYGQTYPLADYIMDLTHTVCIPLHTSVHTIHTADTVHTVHTVHTNIQYIQYIQYTQYTQYIQYIQYTQYTVHTVHTVYTVYVMRTTPNISNLLSPLEESIQHKLIPTITGRNAITDAERKLLALPCRLGGLGLIDPTSVSTTQYRDSEKITEPLVAIILEQKQASPYETWTEMKRVRSSTKKEKHQKLEEEAAAIESH